MVTSPVNPLGATPAPVSPPQIAPIPQTPAPQRAPVQQTPTPGAPTPGFAQSNGVDNARFSEAALQAQNAPPPPGGPEQASNAVNPAANNETAPFPGVIPSAAQGTPTVPSDQSSPDAIQNRIQQAPLSPFQDLTAGQTIDLTA